MRKLSAILCGLLIAGVARAATEKVVTIPGHRLSIAVPAGYSFKVDKDEDGNARVAMENPVWEIAITALLIAESDPKSGTREWQEEKIVTFMAGALSQSKEKDYKFMRLQPRKGSGTYCVFTDEKLKRGQEHAPNDFVHMTGGVRVYGGCVVAFQIMSNDLDSPEYREAFALFTDSFSQ